MKFLIPLLVLALSAVGHAATSAATAELIKDFGGQDGIKTKIEVLFEHQYFKDFADFNFNFENARPHQSSYTKSKVDAASVEIPFDGIEVTGTNSRTGQVCSAIIFERESNNYLDCFKTEVPAPPSNSGAQ